MIFCDLNALHSIFKRKHVLVHFSDDVFIESEVHKFLLLCKRFSSGKNEIYIFYLIGNSSTCVDKYKFVKLRTVIISDLNGRSYLLNVCRSRCIKIGDSLYGMWKIGNAAHLLLILIRYIDENSVKNDLLSEVLLCFFFVCYSFDKLS